MAVNALSYRSITQESSESESELDDCDWKREKKSFELDDQTDSISPHVYSTSNNENQTFDVSKKKKRNNIWSSVLEEQMMSENLQICGLKKKPFNFGDRSSESYDYTLKYSDNRKFPDDISDNMSDNSLDNKPNDVKMQKAKSFKKIKNSKFVDLKNPNDTKVAKKIIKVLNEKKGYLIFRVVKFLGVEKSLELLQKTEELEEAGGVMTMDKSRRKTPGGIFLSLLKSDKSISKKKKNKIFEGEHTMNEFIKKSKLQKRKTSNMNLSTVKMEICSDKEETSLNSNKSNSSISTLLEIKESNVKNEDILEEGEIQD